MSQPEDQPHRHAGSQPPPAGPPPVAEHTAASPQNPYSAPQQMAGPVAVTSNVSGNFAQTRTGITVVYYGLNVVALGIILALVVVLGNQFLLQGQLASVDILMWIATAVTLVGIIMMFVGPFFCLTVPRETGGRPLVMISVILSCCSFLVFIFAILTALVGGFGGAGPASLLLVGLTPMISSFLGMLGTILFVIFLGKLASYVGRRNLIWLATITVIADVFLMALPLIAILLGAGFAANAQAGGPAGLGQVSGAVLIVLGCGGPVFGLIGLLTYVNLLRSLRKHLSLPQFQG